MDEKNRRDRELAQRMYVQNPTELSSRVIGKRIGRHYNTIDNWKKKDNWEEKRRKYWGDIEKLTYTKAVDKISDILSNEAAELALDHLRYYQDLRKFTQMVLAQKFKAIESAPDPIAEVAKLNWKDINYISQIGDRCVKGESAAIGLHLQIDPNSAAKKVESMGYAIVDPT
ncbi:MAG: hypothetical protein QNJ54_28640 [Prochloraceae cyanobacterium]|nr:hypothetical protein [Prochloraceae cyanobacterium]